jgi:hypothetical protein
VDSFAATGIAPSARVIRGRAPDPARPEEFVANRALVDLLHLEVGDHVPVRCFTQAQVDSNAFEQAPAGASFDGVLVGIVDGPDELDDPTPSAEFPMALLDRDVGVVTSLMAVRLEPGATSTDLRRQLDGLAGGSDLSLDTAPLVSSAARNAVSAQAQGLWVIALVAGFAALATLGQVLGRHARVPEVERRDLVALGASRGHLLGESVGRALVPAAAGLVLGVVLAVLLSQLFPIGFVRRLEPHAGFELDAALLLPMLACLLLLLLAWVAAASWLGLRGRAPERPSAVVEAVATRARTASASAGLRFAFARSSRGSGSVAGTLTGLTIAMAGLVGAITFALSLGHLVDDRSRFGLNFDFMLGNGWMAAGSDLRSALEGDGDVKAVMLLGAGAARSGDANVELVGVEPVRGGLSPRLLSGRLPVGSDEVALGRQTADRLHLGMGDELTLDGAGSRSSYRVVGLAVMPTIGNNHGLGEGALLTFDGMRAVAPEVSKNVAAIVLRPGAAPATKQRLASIAYTPPGSEMIPAPIRNVARVDRVPALLAGVLGVLAVLLLANDLLQSVRARRRDLAILRALGADRRCVGRAVHWQATALVVVPLVIGLPVGLVLGRLVYSAFVNRIGADPDPTTPLLVVVLVAAAWVLLANVVGLLPARRARRAPPALLLRSE